MKKTNTSYDDVFRTLLNDCSKWILPLINEMFGEHYSGEEEIIFAPSEHFLNQQDGEYENVQKGVKSVMGGRVLDYEAKTIRNEGISIGIEQGMIYAASMLRNLGYSDAGMVDHLADNYKMSEKQVRTILLKAGIFD